MSSCNPLNEENSVIKINIKLIHVKMVFTVTCLCFDYYRSFLYNILICFSFMSSYSSVLYYQCYVIILFIVHNLNKYYWDIILVRCTLDLLVGCIYFVLCNTSFVFFAYYY